MRFIKLACICLAVLLTGCAASGVKYTDMASSISTVSADQGRIYFLRADSVVGAALQPSIKLDQKDVGDSKPGGFFYVDINPGDHRVTTATEVERELTFTLDAGETKYVKTSPSIGFFVGHITPELMSPDEAFKALQGLKYTGNIATAKQAGGDVAMAPKAQPAYVAPAPTPVEAKPAAVQLYAVTDNASAPAPAAPAPVRQTAAATQTATNVPFQLGVSSITVEKMGKQSGCVSKQGAGLISDSGPVEKYRMTCEDGTAYLAQCEFRQCTQVMQ